MIVDDPIKLGDIFSDSVRQRVIEWYRSTLLSRGVPASRIRYEVFGPDLWAAQMPPEEAAV